MELHRSNLSTLKKNCVGGKFSRSFATRLLMQMLESIEEIHNKYIHRDIKASNFLIGKDMRSVYLTDFGLSKLHINKDGKPITPKRESSFLGTISFASLNAHLGKELSRRDDLWSWYFTLLDFYNEKLQWRLNTKLSMKEVK